MRPLLWLAGLVLGVVAAGATWYAFTSPGFVAGLVGIPTAAAWRALAPKILEPYSKLEEMRKHERSGGQWDWFKHKPRER